MTRRGALVLQSLAYQHDDAGNMTSREDRVAGTYEGFDYDAVNRLRFVRGRDGSTLKEYGYDEISGRRADNGRYSYYTDRGRDWIQSVGGTTYEPDSLGNVRRRTGANVPGGTQLIDYTAFDLPSRVVSDNPSDEGTLFSYGADQSRAVKRNADASVFYEGDLYQATVQNGGEVQHRRMVYSPTGVIAVVTQDETMASVGPRELRYLHADALGSVQMATDSFGGVVASQNFEPFGGSNTGISAAQPYGFTGLEHDVGLGLVNMHGRMYDPDLGQFLSPDPLVSNPAGQGLNRFAYVDNNPLNFTDPSGFSPDDGSAGNGRAGFPLLDLARRYGGEILTAGAVAGGAYALAQLGAGPTAIAASGGTVGAVAGPGAAASSIPASTAVGAAGRVMTTMIAIDHILNPGGLGSAPQPTGQPTRQSASTGTGHPSMGQSRGLQISPGQTSSGPGYRCGVRGHPACGTQARREASISPLQRQVDQIVREWADSYSTQDPSHRTTIRGTTTSPNPVVRVEHTIGIYVDGHGKLQRTKTFTGSLDLSEVDWSDYEGKISSVIGTAHTHPGGPGAENFSADTPRRLGDQSSLRNFVRANRQLIHPKLGAQFYVVHPNGILNWGFGRNLITPVAP